MAAPRIGGVFVDSRIAVAEQRTPSRDAVIAKIAKRQHGVITLAQLLATGQGSALSHLSAADLRGISRFHSSLIAVLSLTTPP
jgi:hypothetical protein